jgi:hypothetical protein
MPRVNPNSYRFANRLWVDSLYENKTPLQVGLYVVLIAIAPWFSCFLISYASGEHTRFVSTPVFYVGSAGIFLTTGALMYGSYRYVFVYMNILKCFELTYDDQRTILKDVLGRYAYFYHHLRAAIICFLFGIIIAIGSTVIWKHINTFVPFFGTGLPRLAAFSDNGWYRDELLHITLAIKAIYVFSIALPLGTAMSVIVRLPLFFYSIWGLPVKLPPKLIKTHYTNATVFYSIISLFWITGTIGFVYLFGNGGDYASASIVFSLIALGIVTFLAPQISYMKAVSDSEKKYLSELADLFVEIGSISTISNNSAKEANDSKILTDRAGMISDLLLHDSWVYPYHQTMVVVGTYVLSSIKIGHIQSVIRFFM